MRLPSTAVCRVGSFAIGAALSHPSAASAAPIWAADFEEGDLSEFPKVGGIKVQSLDRLQVLGPPNPVWAGSKALRIELRPGDIGYPNHDHKVELETNRCQGTEGTERFFAFRVFWHDSYPQSLGKDRFFSWRGDHDDPVRFNVTKAGRVTLSLGAQQVWSTAWHKGRWYEFVTHVKFSADPAVGALEAWVDGQQVLPRTSGITLAKGDGSLVPRLPVDPMFGVAPTGTAEVPLVMFFDEIVCGQTLADVTVASGPGVDGGAPPPPDAAASSDARADRATEPSDTRDEDATIAADRTGLPVDAALATRDAARPTADAAQPPGPATAPALPPRAHASGGCLVGAAPLRSYGPLLLLLSAISALARRRRS